MIRGSASQYVGRGRQAALGWAYLNPALASSSMLFREINRNTSDFTNFIVKSGSLVTTISQRSTDLSGLVDHLSTTTQALAAQQTALGQSIQRLPPFMRLANTTFVNLRNALDDLTPLDDAAKPVAPKLQKLLVQLKPLVEESVPTVRALSNVISHPRTQQRPDRPDPPGRAARRRHRPSGQGKWQAATGRLPAVDDRAQRFHARARDGAPVLQSI